MLKDIPFTMKLQMLKDKYKSGEIDEKTYNEEFKKIYSGQKETVERRRIVEDLEKAIDENNLKKMKEVIKKDLSQRDRRVDCCSEVLIKAARQGRTEFVCALVKSGADVNIQNSEGKTSLMYTAQNGHTETAKVLIGADANLEAKDKNGKTAFLYATENRRLETAKIMVRAGVLISDEHKRAALDVARTNGFTEVEEYIKGLISGKEGVKNPLEVVLARNNRKCIRDY